LLGLVEFGLEGLVDALEGEHGGDAGQVEAVVEELADLAEAGEVVVAVAAGAALAAGRADQAASFVQTQVLRGVADQLGTTEIPYTPTGDSGSSPPAVRVIAKIPLQRLHGPWCRGYNKPIVIIIDPGRGEGSRA
jgi:hypothetical protein